MILLVVIGFFIYHNSIANSQYNYDLNIAYINSRLQSMFDENQQYPYNPPPLPDGEPIYIT